MSTDSNGFSALFKSLGSIFWGSFKGFFSSLFLVFLDPEFLISFRVFMLIGSPKTSFDALRMSPRLSNVFSYSD